MIRLLGGKGPGRPRHEGVFTPAEVKVLRLLRERLSNAEIAVRLGISINTVRYHVANMLSKTGTESRWELDDWLARHPEAEREVWPVSEPGVPARAIMALKIALAGSVALGTVATVLAIASGSLRENADSRSPTSLAAGFSSYTADDLESLGMTEIGSLFVLPSGGTAGVHSWSRASLVGVRVPRGTKITYGWPGPWTLAGDERTLSPANFRISYETGKDRLEVTVWTQSFQDVSIDTIRRTATFGEPSSPDYIEVAVEVSGQNGLYTPAVSADGRLYRGDDPLDLTTIADLASGMKVEASNFASAGVLRLDRGSMASHTACPGPNECSAIISVPHGSAMLSPFAGKVSCVGQRVTVSSSTIDITFVGQSLTYREGSDACGADVEKGGLLLRPGLYRVSADRDSKSTAITFGGELRVGVFQVNPECPCRVIP